MGEVVVLPFRLVVQDIVHRICDEAVQIVVSSSNDLQVAYSVWTERKRGFFFLYLKLTLKKRTNRFGK